MLSFPKHFQGCTLRGETSFWQKFVLSSNRLGHCITSKCETENNYQNKDDNAFHLLSVINLANLEGKRVVVTSFHNELQCGVRMGTCFRVSMTACNTDHYLKRFNLLPAKEYKRPFIFWYLICVTAGMFARCAVQKKPCSTEAVKTSRRSS